jgi:hypothetical protein
MECCCCENGRCCCFWRTGGEVVLNSNAVSCAAAPTWSHEKATRMMLPSKIMVVPFMFASRGMNGMK